MSATNAHIPNTDMPCADTVSMIHNRLIIYPTYSTKQRQLVSFSDLAMVFFFANWTLHSAGNAKTFAKYDVVSFFFTMAPIPTTSRGTTTLNTD